MDSCDPEALALVQDIKEETDKTERLAKFHTGMRVRIEIANPDEWSRRAVDAMNGQLGTIDEVSTRDQPLSGNILVRFDREIKGWHAHQCEISRHWFETYDLKVLAP